MVTGCNLSSNDESTVVHQPSYLLAFISFLSFRSVLMMDPRWGSKHRQTKLEIVDNPEHEATKNFHRGLKTNILQIHDWQSALSNRYSTGHHACNGNSWKIPNKSKGITPSDADWAESVDDRKNTSGGAFYMGSRLVSWFNKKQSLIALSTSEAEYVVVVSFCTQLLWMMQTLQGIQITCTPPISILCDNTSAISISKNPVMHSKTKHIPIKYHFLREQMLEQKVKLEYVPSKEQVVDIFTKPLPRDTFEYLRQKLGVVSASSCC
eukprot:PITA_30309